MYVTSHKVMIFLVYSILEFSHEKQNILHFNYFKLTFYLFAMMFKTNNVRVMNESVPSHIMVHSGGQ